MMLAASASVKPPAPTLLQRRDLLVDGRDGEIELAGDLARQALHLGAVAELALERQEAVADVVERRALLLEADQERERPLDVGAPVEVVADPRGDRREPRPELEGLVAEALGRRREEVARAGRRRRRAGCGSPPARARCS